MRARAFTGTLLLIVLALSANLAFTQTPQGFSYQAVIRDGSGAPISNHDVTLRFTLQSSTESPYYIEWQTKKTNNQGVVSLTIGEGTITLGTFTSIPWNSGEVFLKVEVDPSGGTSYTTIGTSKINSVPLALYASSGQQGPAGNDGVSINWSGTLSDPPTSPTLNQAYYNSTEKKSYIWNGSSWSTLAQDGEQGNQGPQGAPGTGLVNKGNWVSNTPYVNGDYVFDRSTANESVNSMWICQVAVTSSSHPYLDNVHWVEFQAPTGPQGVQGVPGTPGNNGISIQWMGTRTSDPSPASLNQAYYNSLDKKAYIFNGSIWTILAQDGAVGSSGSNGISIQWMGTKTSDPSPASLNQAYYNSNDKKAYIYNGTIWTILAQDGTQGPAGPLVSGTNGQTLRNNGTTWEASRLLFSDKTNSRIGINTASPSATLHVNGSVRLGGQLIDNKNLSGSLGNVLSQTAEGVVWQAPSGNILGTGTAGRMALWSGPSTLSSLPNLTFSNSLSVVGNPTGNPDDPIFEVKNNSGQVIFGVYQEGVRINIKDTSIAKGAKGGFAVGGLTSKSKNTVEYLRITPDSARIFVNDVTNQKGAKGGFAVGGLTSAGKATSSHDLMFVAHDSTRIYIDDSTTPKGAKGGFAVGGLTSKGSGNYMQMTPKNYFIGEQSGGKITSGLYNSFLGYQAGFSNSTGSSNVFIGYKTGYSNTTGLSNVFIGNLTGYLGNSGSSNVLLGDSAGYSNTSNYNVFLGNSSGKVNSAQYNAFMGYKAGLSNTTGESNVFIGNESGKYNQTGHSNVFIGYQSGYKNTGGQSEWQGGYNTFIGNAAGYQNTTGASDVFIGNMSGYKNTTGYRNVFLGSGAGYENTTGCDNMYFGTDAGHFNTEGTANIFIGQVAGYHNQTGSENIFFGTWSGGFNTSGSNNICIGRQTGMQNNGSDNVYIGPMVGMYNSSGANNLALGSSAGLNNAGSGNVFLGYNAGYHEAGSNKLYIENSDTIAPLIGGNFANNWVGINCMPNAALDVNGTEASPTDAAIQNTRANYPQLIFKASNGGTNAKIWRIVGRSTNDFEIQTLDDSYSGEVTAMQINRSGTSISNVLFPYGNLGIGTLSPGYTVESYGTNAALIAHYFNNTRGGISALATQRLAMLSTSSSDNLVFGYTSANQSDFSTNFIERMRIVNSSGYVGIGTNNPLSNLEVKVTGGNGYAGIGINKAGGKNITLNQGVSGRLNFTVPGDVDLVTFDFNSKLVGINRTPTTYMLEVGGTIWANGATISAGASTWSDARFKTNVETITNALFNICKIRGVTYDWDNTNSNTLNFPKGRQIGVIAQEVEKIFPELITTGADGYKSVAYEKISAILIEAIKDQQKIIENQQVQINELKEKNNEIDALKTELETIKVLLKK